MVTTKTESKVKIKGMIERIRKSKFKIQNKRVIPRCSFVDNEFLFFFCAHGLLYGTRTDENE